MISFLQIFGKCLHKATSEKTQCNSHKNKTFPETLGSTLTGHYSLNISVDVQCSLSIHALKVWSPMSYVNDIKMVVFKGGISGRYVDWIGSLGRSFHDQVLVTTWELCPLLWKTMCHLETLPLRTPSPPPQGSGSKNTLPRHRTHGTVWSWTVMF